VKEAAVPVAKLRLKCSIFETAYPPARTTALFCRIRRISTKARDASPVSCDCDDQLHDLFNRTSSRCLR